KWEAAMSFETRGQERPAGGPGSATAEGVSMQILSTEHWSLLATRSLGYTEFFSRANMFFSVLSGAVIALALIAQAGRFETFIAAAILLLAITFFVAVVAGAWGAVVSVALGFPQLLAVAAGVGCFLITMVGSSIWGQRVARRFAKGTVAQFPSPS